MNLLDYISIEKIVKKADVALLIPTFRSASITRKLLLSLCQQTGLDFDIIVIDNASDDYVSLKEEFPTINYILINKNTGASGATQIGMAYARSKDYKYFIISDNDSFIIGNDSLKKMFDRLMSRPDVDVVMPRCIESDMTVSEDKILKSAYTYHYFFARSAILDKIISLNFNYFLLMDDLALTLNAISVAKVLILGDVFYFHEGFKPKHWQNKEVYLYIRNLLILIRFEPAIKIKYKIWQMLHIIYRILLGTSLAIKLRDITYIQVMCLAMGDFLVDFEQLDLNKLPANKYVLKEVSKSEAFWPRSIARWPHLFRDYLVHSNFLNKDTYYRFEKNK